MNSDDFEKRLQRQALRQVPGEWRADVLAAARQASLAEHARCTTRHVSALRSLLSTLNSQLSTILWPHPVAWAGLAAVWLLIGGLNLATREAPLRVARHAAPLSPEVLMASQEQERLLAELIGRREAPVAEPPKAGSPRPRSDRRPTLLTG
jgi:hypothetical protein